MLAATRPPHTTTEEEAFFGICGITATAMPLHDAGLCVREHYVSVCKEHIFTNLISSKRHDV